MGVLAGGAGVVAAVAGVDDDDLLRRRQRRDRRLDLGELGDLAGAAGAGAGVQLLLGRRLARLDAGDLGGVGRGGRACGVGRLVGLKLVVQPLLTLAIARFVSMPAAWFDTALLLAALPTGTGPFILAKLYDRDAPATSRAILLSTVLAAASVSAIVIWIGR